VSGHICSTERRWLALEWQRLVRANRGGAGNGQTRLYGRFVRELIRSRAASNPMRGLGVVNQVARSLEVRRCELRGARTLGLVDQRAGILQGRGGIRTTLAACDADCERENSESPHPPASLHESLRLLPYDASNGHGSE
jgi:hypothetical protein